MNEIINEKKSQLILKARETKKILVRYLLGNYNVVCLKANIMGSNKNVCEAYIIVNYFERILDRYDYISKYRYSSADGPYILYTFSKSKSVKSQMITLEEQEAIGRLVDIDVYENNSIKSVNRSVLRKCLLCNQDAFICNRLQNHSKEKLFEKIDQIIFEKLENIVCECLNKAIEMELELPNKFGCVSKKDKGSHQDMDFSVMEKAKKAIVPFLLSMFKAGCQAKTTKLLRKEIKIIGIQAEEQMLEVTSNVNCYKGLIFSLGLIVSSLGYMFKRKISFDNIFTNITKMVKDIDNEYQNSQTFGANIYKENKIKGAREEAKDGFIIVKRAFYECCDLSNSELIRTLVYIINNIDDTVMIKRARSLNKYYEIKEKFKNIDVYNNNDLLELDNYCVKENISCGGSADILICTIFLKLIDEKINISGERF